MVRAKKGGMRVLVTGAAGFIGSNLVPRLLSEGHDVLGIDNLFLGKKEYVEPLLAQARFQFVEMDLLEKDQVLGIFRTFHPDVVWHLAANSDISYGTLHTDFDLKGGTLVTYNILDAMRLEGPKKLVFSSSGAVYGEPTVMPTPEDYGPLLPISLYAASKLACEGLITAYAHNYDMQVWMFRFGNVVGPNPTHGAIYDFVRKLAKDDRTLPVLGDGTQSKPYLHVDDCIEGMRHGVGRAGDQVNYFNLTPDDATTVRDIAEWTLSAMGLPGTPIAYSGGNRGWRGDVPTVRLDGSKLKRLGWAPRLRSNQAVERAIADIVRQCGNR